MKTKITFLLIAHKFQIMLTQGESVKGDAKEGMTANYFERKVFLKIK